MKFTINRHSPGLTGTIGDLLVDGDEFAHTLEDLVHPAEGRGCIPAGTYEIKLTFSPRVYKGSLWSPLTDCRLPLLFNVPGREGIRVHAGNTEADVVGCIAVGHWRGGEFLRNSRAVLEGFCDLMVAAERMKQPVFIEVNDPEE